MTQLEFAKLNKITPLMREIARREEISALELCKRIKQGFIVLPLNNRKKISKPCGIGKGLKTKINANIGTSTDKSSIDFELKKLDCLVKYGADTVMDLSIGGNLALIRKKVIHNSPIPVGTVCIYEAAVEAKRRKGSFLKMTKDDLMDTIKMQAQDGVDFFTIHSGVTKSNVEILRKKKRLLGIVSRGGAILANWITHHKRENPLFEYFDDILEIAKEYDITLSLGDGLRPGSILDATDTAQVSELKTLGMLCERAKEKGVQVMIEGPGHVPLNQIKKNVELEKKICNQAPFYVLGPLVTDRALGYDHISSAIGACLAASVGADFLCYVTPSEHLKHPDIEDVKEGVIASKIAAHAADISKGMKYAWQIDKRLSKARKERDWKTQISLSFDPDKAKRYRKTSNPKLEDVCTMCSEYCSIKLMEKCFG